MCRGKKDASPYGKFLCHVKVVKEGYKMAHLLMDNKPDLPCLLEKRGSAERTKSAESPTLIETNGQSQELRRE